MRAGLVAAMALGLVCAGCGGGSGANNGNGNPSPVPAPVAGLSPASLSFGSQNVGTSSSPQPVTLSNTGNAALNLASVSVSGDFSQSNNCGASLAAGASCAIQVSFAPAASGQQTGALEIQDNASGSPQTVGLTGAGNAPAGSTATLYVATNGSDSFSGSLAAPNASNTDGPFATFDRARRVVQALNKTGLSHVIVQFRAGAYVLPATEQFTAADSGSSATAIVYENASSAESVGGFRFR